MTGKKPTPEGTVLLQLRRQSGWTQARLERTARLSRGTLSLYETGKRPFGRPLLNRLAVTLGHSLEDVDRALAALAKIPALDAPPALTPASLLPHERRAVEAAAEQAAARVRLGVGTRLIEARIRSERQEAANLWSQLRKVPTFRACRDRIDADPRFRSWALSERLCDESSHAAARDVGTSRALARLALKVAEMTPGGDAWRCRVQGYTWAFVSNSLRVGGDFQSAEEAIVHADEFWKTGKPAEPAPLDGGQILSLAASLCNVQKRFGEAWTMLTAAAQYADSSAKLAPLKLKFALVLELQGAYEEALEVLGSSRSLVADAKHPRLEFLLEFGSARNLCLLGRFRDGSHGLGRVQRMAFNQGNELDILRVRWLSARISAGQGRKLEAIAELTEVEQGFVRKNLLSDAGLAALEIAELQKESWR